MSDSRNDQIKQQEAEREKRLQAQKAWEDMDGRWSQHYKAQLYARQKKKISFGLADEIPSGPPITRVIPELDDNGAALFPDNQPDLEAPTKAGDKPGSEGFFPVYYEDENGNKIKQPFELYIDSEGGRPTILSRENWSALIHKYAQVDLSKTMILKVSPNPNHPKDAAKQLKEWLQDCIENGVAAEYSGNTSKFLAHYASELPKDTKKELDYLMECSRMGLAETEVRRADKWVRDDMAALDKLVTDRTDGDQKWTELNTKLDTAIQDGEPEAITAAVNAMTKELQARTGKLSASQRRLDTVKTAEEQILNNPELLVRTNYLKSPTGAEIKSQHQAIELINQLNSPPKDENKRRLLAKMETEQEYLLNIKNNLKTRIANIDANVVPNDKKETLRKDLPRLDTALGKAAIADSALKTKRDAAMAWNDADANNVNGRKNKVNAKNAEIEAARPKANLTEAQHPDRIRPR